MTFATPNKKKLDWTEYDKESSRKMNEALKEINKKYEKSSESFEKVSLIPRGLKRVLYTALIAGTIGFFAGGGLIKERYNRFLYQENMKIDSIYQAKVDSVKQVYENALEKISRE